MYTTLFPFLEDISHSITHTKVLKIFIWLKKPSTNCFCYNKKNSYTNCFCCNQYLYFNWKSLDYNIFYDLLICINKQTGSQCNWYWYFFKSLFWLGTEGENAMQKMNKHLGRAVFPYIFSAWPYEAMFVLVILGKCG